MGECKEPTGALMVGGGNEIAIARDVGMDVGKRFGHRFCMLFEAVSLSLCFTLCG